MKAIFVFTTAILVAVASASADEAPVKGPNGLSILCSEFSKQPNGNLQSSKDATLSYPDRPGSFGNNSFGPHAIVSNGVDVATFIIERCGDKLKSFSP